MQIIHTLRMANKFLLSLILVMAFSACGGSGTGGEGSRSADPLPPSIGVIIGDVVVGIEATIDASASKSSNNGVVSFAWGLVSKPSDSNLSLSVTNENKLTVTFDRLGEYEISLNVFDNLGASSTINLKIEPDNTLPVVSITKSFQHIVAGDTVVFDASNSLDADGHNLSFTWFVADKPQQSKLEIPSTATDSSNPIEFDLEGSYEIGLTVSDSFGESTSTEVIEVVDDSSLYSLYPLDFRPWNTRYNSLLEKLYLLDRDQPYLYSFDMKTRQLDKIALPDIGNVFAFSPDGTKAAISFQSDIIFVDLINNIITSRVFVEVPAGSLAYLEDQVVVFPKGSNFNSRIRAIRFATELSLSPNVLQENGLVSGDDSVREGATAYYNKINGDIQVLHEDNLERFVPSIDTMQEHYRLPSAAGDEGNSSREPVGYDLWIMNDGNIFTSVGNLIKGNYIGSEREQNELLLRRLNLGENYGSGFVNSAHPSDDGDTFWITINPSSSDIDDSKIYEFDYSNFEAKGEYQLPSMFDRDGAEWPIYGQRVYAGTDEASHLALAYVDTRSGIEKPFVIAVYENGALVKNKKPSIESTHELFSNSGSDNVIDLSANIFGYKDKVLDYQLSRPEQSAASLVENSVGNLVVSADKTGMYEVAINAMNKFGEALTSYIRFQVQEPYQYVAKELDGTPNDSLYDASSNSVFVTTTSNKLIKLDGETLESSQIEFENIELFDFQISPNGQLLVVSGEETIYVIKSDDLSLLRTFEIGYIAQDIMFVDNDRFIISTRRLGAFGFDYTSLLIHVVNGVAYNQEVMSDLNCGLQDSHQRLVCIRPLGFSNQALKSFIVTDSTIDLVGEVNELKGDSQYYPNTGNLKISPSQEHALTRGGFIYSLTEPTDRSTDLAYLKSFDSGYRVLRFQEVEWSQSGEYIYRINSSSSPFDPEIGKSIEIFSFDNMTMKEKIKVPKSLNDGEMFARFVLSGKDDNNFFVITCKDQGDNYPYGAGPCELVAFERTP